MDGWREEASFLERKIVEYPRWVTLNELAEILDHWGRWESPAILREAAGRIYDRLTGERLRDVELTQLRIDRWATTACPKPRSCKNLARAIARGSAIHPLELVAVLLNGEAAHHPKTLLKLAAYLLRCRKHGLPRLIDAHYAPEGLRPPEEGASRQRLERARSIISAVNILTDSLGRRCEAFEEYGRRHGIEAESVARRFQRAKKILERKKSSGHIALQSGDTQTT